LNNVLSKINTHLLAPLLPLAVLTVGVFFLFKLRFFVFLHPLKVTAPLLKKNTDSGISPFKALTVALAATLGVGNIIGVSTAITLGGAGALFWMWIASIFSMIIKYAETVLSVLHRRSDKNGFYGGPMYYITSKAAAVLFCMLCILCSFIVGNVLQVNAVSDSFYYVLKVPKLAIGIVLASFAFIVIYNGVKGIANLTSKLVPIMSILYVLLSLYIIVRNREYIPQTVKRIFSEAFALRPIAGGGTGYLFYRAIRYGVARGIVSNEAGCGTAPIAHSAAKTNSAAEQGCFGMFEVFADTTVMCTVTGLVLLTTGADETGLSGIDIVIWAFSQEFGAVAGYILAFAVLCFAFSTIISCSYYGFECVRYLFKSTKALIIYIVIYTIFAVIGSVISHGLMWELADFVIAAMTILNTIYLIKRSGEIKKETERFISK